MVKILYLIRKKTILIAIAILILCVIIALIALMNMYSDKAPVKAVYVFESLK
ncbi:MAG: hypothetical protein ACYDG2_07455 [Ruminiclostridium sp.]